MSDSIPYKSSGGLIRKAPDLTYFSTKAVSSNGISTISAINPSAGLTTAISLSGKWAIFGLLFPSPLAETYTIKETIDGVVTLNESFTANTTGISVWNGQSGSLSSAPGLQSAFGCNSTYLLEIQSTTDTNIDLQYNASPLL